MKKRTFIVGIGILGMLAAVSAAASDLPDTPEAIRKLYVAKCGSCHKLRDPNEYDAEKWESWMVRMRKKSKVSDEQYEILNKYINTLRTGKK